MDIARTIFASHKLIMATIQLDTVKHKGKQILLLKFPYDNELIRLAKQLAGASFSGTYKSWYVPYSTEVMHKIKKLFNGVAEIDAHLLKEKLEKNKNAPPDIKDKKENWVLKNSGIGCVRSGIVIIPL
jgi:hypothetical protein